MSYQLDHIVNKQEWDDLVQQSLQGTIFLKTAYLDSLSIEYDLLILKHNSSLCLGAVILKKDHVPLLAPYHYSLYQGILFSPTITMMSGHRKTHLTLEWISQFLQEIENQYSTISFCHHHTLQDLRSFQWFHYHEPKKGLFDISIRYTGLIQLDIQKDFSTYLTTIRSVRRQEYLKAQKLALKIKASNDISTFMDLYQKTFDRQAITLSSIELTLVRSIIQAAIDGGYGKLWICTNKEGTPLSVTFFLNDQHTSYYLFGATNPQYRSSGSNTFLILEQIRTAMNQGIKHIDLVGVNSPNRGDYKTSFNAQVIPYYITTWKSP